MGQQLSHAGSSSIKALPGRLPDENYAREAMQLETVGLDMLNLDGTLELDSLGNSIPTYDTNDILTFARAWTGLSIGARRGNYEEWPEGAANWNDPMELVNVGRHNWFPKKDLVDHWIGDRYPLCIDNMPAQAFFKKGAQYK